MSTGATDQPLEHRWYEIRLEGRLDPRWSAWFDGMDVTHHIDGTRTITVLHGHVVDQSALHGLLVQLRDLGLPLISVARTHPAGPRHTAHLNEPTGD